jgi:hypothetical protein
MTQPSRKRYWSAHAPLKWFSFASLQVQWYPKFPSGIPLRQAVLSVEPRSWALPFSISWRWQSVTVHLLCLRFKVW